MPKKAAHRISGDNAECRIRVSAETKAALDVYTKEHCMTADLVIWQLLEFYRLERMDWLIERLHVKYACGISLTDRAHLSVLYSLLGEIDRISGLNP